jgi:hypothetical protein
LNKQGSPSGAPGLTSLTYRSRAAAALAPKELHAIERVAQARNRAEGLTGRAIYDDGRFFQWLEGPPDAVSRVWESVRRDRRHTDIEDLRILPTSARVFDGWDMKLSLRGQEPLEAPSPPTLSLVAALDPLVPLREDDLLPQVGKDPSAVLVIPVVHLLSEAVAIPHLFAKHGRVRRFLPPASPAATSLLALLIAADPRPAAAMLRRLYTRAGSLAPLCATVLEPAARGLGDLWLADECNQLSVTLGLARLQATIRQLTVEATPVTIGLPVVLVAPQPGEVHLLGASLDAELLWQSGWDTHREFPETDAALQATLAETWVDVLDLSLSPAMPREDWLSRMAATIASARIASRNPALTVVASGRAFFEQCEACATVGADASTTSALQIVLTVTSALQATRTNLAQRSLLVTTS